MPKRKTKAGGPSGKTRTMHAMQRFVNRMPAGPGKRTLGKARKMISAKPRKMWGMKTKVTGKV